MLQVGPPSVHYCCAVVLHSSIVLPPVGHSSNHEYHCCQLTGQSSSVSNFCHTFKVFIWLTSIHVWQHMTCINSASSSTLLDCDESVTLGCCIWAAKWWTFTFKEHGKWELECTEYRTQVFVCDQLCKFCEADSSHWTYCVRVCVSSTDIHRYVTSFRGSKISDVVLKPRMVSRFVWPNSKPTCAVILLKRSLIIGHLQESDVELILSEEFIDKHCINWGFGSGLPSGHDVLQFPSVYRSQTGLMISLSVKNCVAFFMIWHGDVSQWMTFCFGTVSSKPLRRNTVTYWNMAVDAAWIFLWELIIYLVCWFGCVRIYFELLEAYSNSVRNFQ